METPPRGGDVDLEGVWPGGSGPIHISRNTTLSTLPFHYISSSTLLPGESPQGWVLSVVSSPVGDSGQVGPSGSGRGLNTSTPAGVMEAVDLASKGAQLLESGLSTEVFETILHFKAPSMRKLCALKCRVFTLWCGNHQLDTLNCPVGTMLGLQDQFSAGISLSILNFFMAAIAAYHTPLGGDSLGRNPKGLRYHRIALRLISSSYMRVTAWDLTVVLEGLSTAPFW